MRDIMSTGPGFRAVVRGALMDTARKDHNTIRYAPVSTPLGQLYMAFRGRAVCYAALGSGARGFERRCVKRFGVRAVQDPRLAKGLASRVVDHVTGKRGFSAALDFSGLTPFQRLVLKKTLQIPAGEVRSYQWVAKEIGARRAVRAVGTALARNPLPILIPCHRVVRTDGRIGHYSAGGPGVKAKLLALEGVDLAGVARLATRRIRFVGNGTSKRFCLPSCHSARRIPEQNVVYFTKQREALRKRYRPCQNCRPT